MRSILYCASFSALNIVKMFIAGLNTFLTFLLVVFLEFTVDFVKQLDNWPCAQHLLGLTRERSWTKYHLNLLWNFKSIAIQFEPVVFKTWLRCDLTQIKGRWTRYQIQSEHKTQTFTTLWPIPRWSEICLIGSDFNELISCKLINIHRIDLFDKLNICWSFLVIFK